MTETRKPELLSPAGEWDSLRAAVANGADAVYFGLSDFNARRRATNFTLDELPEALAYLHDHNVRGYVAVNTLIFSDELGEAQRFASAIAQAGADAVIAADLGLLALLRRLAPTLPLHASTQTTQTSAPGIAMLAQMGVRRVILAREMALPEIARLAQACPVELEVFVHGALCMSYSGQCLASEVLWGRSANRGTCGQACRLPYTLMADGRIIDLGHRHYLLSPQDLAAWDRIAELTRAGVACFKIEGRLKSAQYVAAATRMYRSAIDAAIAGEPFRPDQNQHLQLAQGFSRGFTHGFLDGNRPRELVHGLYPNSRGVEVGVARTRTPKGLVVELAPSAGPLKAGDGVLFTSPGQEQPQGARIFEVRPHRPSRGSPGGTLVELTFGNGVLDLNAIDAGSTVWKTDDPQLGRLLEASFRRDCVPHPARLSFRVRAIAGEPLEVLASDEVGRQARAAGPAPLEPAAKHPLTRALLVEQLGRLGQTPFALGDVELIGPAGPADDAAVMAPKSVLNDLRRRVVDQLLAMRQAASVHPVAVPDALAQLRPQPPARPTVPAAPALAVLARTLQQVQAVCEYRDDALPAPALVWCELSDADQWATALEHCRSAGLEAGLVTPRVIKDADIPLLNRMGQCNPDAILVRNLTALAVLAREFPRIPLVGDTSLNAVNELTAAALADLGCRFIAPALDANGEQLARMLQHFDAARVEMPLLLHAPLMHTEHCLAGANLPAGRTGSSCGHACKGHEIRLRDRLGENHPIRMDSTCRNTLYHAHAQCSAGMFDRLQALGVRRWRMEFLDETPGHVRGMLGAALAMLAGRLSPQDAWRKLQLYCPASITQGSWGW